MNEPRSDKVAKPAQPGRAKPYEEEGELASYLWRFHAHLFTPLECKAYWAVVADEKTQIGSPDVAEFIWKRHGLAEDPSVLAALADGVETFRLRAARRVFMEHGSTLFINRCGQCGRVVATPKAQQCLWCGFDWHTRAQPIDKPPA